MRKERISEDREGCRIIEENRNVKARELVGIEKTKAEEATRE